MFDVPSHPDFLGSILGTGITREKVGDIILLGDQGAQFLTAPELVSHFESSLTQVSRCCNMPSAGCTLPDRENYSPHGIHLTPHPLVEVALALWAWAAACLKSCERLALRRSGQSL